MPHRRSATLPPPHLTASYSSSVVWTLFWRRPVRSVGCVGDYSIPPVKTYRIFAPSIARIVEVNHAHSVSLKIISPLCVNRWFP